jgi:hypothetical protein
MDIKVIAIVGKTPPYSSKIVLPNVTYPHILIRRIEIIIPHGLLYLELLMKMKYSQKKKNAIVKTLKSFRAPITKIRKYSLKLKLLLVIG